MLRFFQCNLRALDRINAIVPTKKLPSMVVNAAFFVRGRSFSNLEEKFRMPRAIDACRETRIEKLQTTMKCMGENLMTAVSMSPIGEIEYRYDLLLKDLANKLSVSEDLPRFLCASTPCILLDNNPMRVAALCRWIITSIDPTFKHAYDMLVSLRGGEPEVTEEVFYNGQEYEQICQFFEKYNDSQYVFDEDTFSLDGDHCLCNNGGYKNDLRIIGFPISLEMCKTFDSETGFPYICEEDLLEPKALAKGVGGVWEKLRMLCKR